MKRILRSMLMLTGVVLLGTACATEITTTQLEAPEAGDPVAVIRTSKGDITIRLFPQYAPKAVENFVTHARNGYYDGVIFHRVIDNFMIQTGDPTGTGSGGESIWGEPFDDEVGVGLFHIRGALSMANAGPGTNGSQFFIVNRTDIGDEIRNEFARAIEDPWHRTALNVDAGEEYVLRKNIPLEFLENYVAHGGTPHLDYPGIRRGFKHTVFGQVIDGMDVVDAIAAVEINAVATPLENIYIHTIDITKF